MSATWNGRSMPGRADTVASRCWDIIEGGMARLGLALDKTPAPSAFNQLLTCRGTHLEAQPFLTKDELLERNAEIVAAWRALPMGERVVHRLAVKFGRGDETIRRILTAAGERINSQERLLVRKARMRNDQRQRVLAAWKALPPHQRTLERIYRAAGVKYKTCCELVAEAGLRLHVRTPAEAAR